MLETRSEAEAGGGMGRVADADAHRSQRLRVCLVSLDVRQQRHIVARLSAGMHAGQMAFQIAG